MTIAAISKEVRKFDFLFIYGIIKYGQVIGHMQTPEGLTRTGMFKISPDCFYKKEGVGALWM